MSRWRVIYEGAEDRFSTNRVAAPSWHSFDKRVWKKTIGKDELELTLTNLSNERRSLRPAGKIALYYAVARVGNLFLVKRRGTNWQDLVREVRCEAVALVNERRTR